MDATFVQATFVQFATAADHLCDHARRHGLLAPAFRCPPRVPGADRTLRRRDDGGAVVSVRVRGRPAAAVAADLVEGVVVANGLDGQEAAQARRLLLAALDERS